jgi:hypothetical protein
MMLRVSVPVKMKAEQVRREVRTLVNDQCNYGVDVEPGDLRVQSCSPAPRGAA